MTTSTRLRLHNVSDDHTVTTERKEVTVLVTGYGEFLEYKTNSSWAIASVLPTSLPPTASCPVPIRIVVPPKPLRVSYAHVVAVAPKLLSGTYSPDDPPASSPANASSDAEAANLLPIPDIVLHIGMAAGRKHYTLERQSRAGHFDKLKDVDGRVFSAAEAERLFAPCPQVLKPTFDTADVWRRWRTYVTDSSADLRPSDDPGYYLCGFVYYVSMAWYWKRNLELRGQVANKDRPVAFLHVPDLDAADVKTGKEVAVGLIKALVASREKTGIVDPLDPGDDDAAVGAEDASENVNARWDGVRELPEAE